MPVAAAEPRPFEGDWVELAPHVKPHGCLQRGQRGKVLQDVSADQGHKSTLCYLVQAPQGRPTWYAARDLAVVQWPPPPPAHCIAPGSEGAAAEEADPPRERHADPAPAEPEPPSRTLSYSLTTSDCRLVLEVEAPAVRSVGELDLSVTDGAVSVSHTAEDPAFDPLRVPLRHPVDPDGAGAKWDKKRRVLRVTLPRRPPGSDAEAQPPAPPPAPAPPPEPAAAAGDPGADGARAEPPAAAPAPAATASEPACAPPADRPAAETGLAAEGTEEGFRPCAKWGGKQAGWYFGTEPLGTGYYKDWRLVELCGGLELGQKVYATRDIAVEAEVAVREGDIGWVRGPGRGAGRVRVLWEARRDTGGQLAAWHLLAQQQAMDCATSALCPRLLAPGARVEVTGLTGRAELNGKTGTVVRRSDDRWGVRFDDRSAGEKALRRANLIITRGAETV